MVQKNMHSRRGVGQVAVDTAGSSQSASERRAAETEVRALIAKFSPAHQRLVAAVRRTLHKRLPSAFEVVYEYRAWFVISYSPSEHGYEGVLAIRGDADGVKLYFTHGKGLPDPDKLLKGSSQTRFIAVEGASALNRPAVARLIDEAIARNRVPFAPDGDAPVIVLSQSTQKKRRAR